MQLQTYLTTLAVLAAGVTAAPITSANTASAKTIFKRDSINDCGESNFTNQSSGGSPLVDDCRVLMKNIAGGGSWHRQVIEGYQELASFGSCVFAVSGRDELAATGYYVGNSDIIDLINSSIDQFQWSDGEDGGKMKVGALGDMLCQADFGTLRIDWEINHA